MDVLGLTRETLEPLSVRRDKQLEEAFQDILESADHPGRRFIKEVLHSYSFRSQRVRVPVPQCAQIGVGNHLYSAGRKCKWHNRLFFSFCL